MSNFFVWCVSVEVLDIERQKNTLNVYNHTFLYMYTHDLPISFSRLLLKIFENFVDSIQQNDKLTLNIFIREDINSDKTDTR